MLSLLLFAIIAVRADTVTISDKSAIDVPPENLRATSISVSDEAVHSISINYFSTPPAITGSGTVSASISQVAATLTFTGGMPSVAATSA